LHECDRNVRDALHLLGSPIPGTTIQFVGGLFVQVIRQVNHRFFTARLRRSLLGDERNVALEMARLYELMSRMYFYSNETVPILYTVVRFLNEGEKAGTSAE